MALLVSLLVSGKHLVMVGSYDVPSVHLVSKPDAEACFTNEH